jgi:ubiquinone/menaquinone biosynthesis C-methylase UbiE
MEDFFYELFEGLPRQGPGDVLITRKCFEIVADLNEKLKVLDVGCGSGFQTLFMALSSAYSFVAVDNHQPYLDQLLAEATEMGLSDRIQTHNMDMNNLKFDDHAFDIILAEGSIYQMGIENALKAWKHLIKPEGFIIFSDMCWTRTPKSQELIDFWNAEYPGMMSLEQVDPLTADCAYKTSARFALDVSGWVNNYYYPLQMNINKARVKYAGQPDVLAAIEPVQKEIDLFYEYQEYYTYYFYVLQKIN